MLPCGTIRYSTIWYSKQPDDDDGSGNVVHSSPQARANQRCVLATRRHHTRATPSHAVPRHPTSSEAKAGKQTRLTPGSIGGRVTSRPITSRPVTGPRSQPGSSPRSPPAHHRVKRTQSRREGDDMTMSTSAPNNCTSQCMTCSQKATARSWMYDQLQSNAPWYDTRTIIPHLHLTRHAQTPLLST